MTGAGGQLAEALRRLTSDHGACVFMSRSELDITDPVQVGTAVSDVPCDWVVNAAAYTAVDAAESDEEEAFRVNSDGPRTLAEACVARGVRLVHVSTDFVFDGSSNRPYETSDPPRPISVYGRSKLAGEKAITRTLAGEELIIRTSWLYGGTSTNFVSTMLRLMGVRNDLSVVADQFGTPTWSMTLAGRLLGLIEADARGIHHITDSGSATWYDFAVAIRDLALDADLLNDRIPIYPINTSEYPTPADRPRFSVLAKGRTDEVLGGCAPHWRSSLKEHLSLIAGPLGDLKGKGDLTT